MPRLAFGFCSSQRKWSEPNLRSVRNGVEPVLSAAEQSSLIPARKVRGRRRVDGKPERVSDREIANQKRREEFHLPALFSLRLKLCPALLHSYRKEDVTAVLQVDAECVRIAFRQVASRHIEDPLY